MSFEVEDMAEDMEGNLWVATPGGIFRFNGEGFARVIAREGDHFSSEVTETLYADEEGFLAARKHVNSLIRHEGLMFQPYIETVETFGEVSAIFMGGAFSHGARARLAAGCRPPRRRR